VGLASWTCLAFVGEFWTHGRNRYIDICALSIPRRCDSTFRTLRISPLRTLSRRVTPRTHRKNPSLPRLGCDCLSNSCRSGVLRRNEGGRGAQLYGRRITAGAPNHCVSAKSLRGRRKLQTLSQVLSSTQYICFRKTSGSNIGAPDLLLAPGAI